MSFDKKYCAQVVDAYLNQKYDLKDNKKNIILVQENCDIEKLGRYICALANYAAYMDVPYAYAIWGIDKEKNLIGTMFKPPLQTTLTANIMIKAIYDIMPLQIEGKTVVVMEVARTNSTTMQYKGVEYILNEKLQIVRLDDYPEMEKKLWEQISEKKSFLRKIAKSNVSIEEIFDMLDCITLFDILDLPYTGNPSEVISKLLELRFIDEKNTGKYDITNLGALLIAKHLKQFASVAYKAVRVIEYDGNDNTGPAKELTGEKGYIIGFKGLIDFVTMCLKPLFFPAIIVRELVANALIHQNFNVKGSPIISIYQDHIEIVNPGSPLIETNRFIDYPPMVRNESLIYVMRKAGICESRGSGYDKVISCLEKHNFVTPVITAYEDRTKVSLYAKTGFDCFTKQERIRACYAHVCLNFVRNQISNNTTLRKRFRLSEANKYKISRVYADTCNTKLILMQGSGMKNREYIPYWAHDGEKNQMSSTSYGDV